VSLAHRHAYANYEAQRWSDYLHMARVLIGAALYADGKKAAVSHSGALKGFVDLLLVNFGDLMGRKW